MRLRSYDLLYWYVFQFRCWWILTKKTSSRCRWNQIECDKMHRLFLSVPNIVFSVHSPLSLKDIASNISSDIWRNGMLSGPGLPAWSIEDKTLWFSGAFSRNPLFFSLFVYLLLPSFSNVGHVYLFRPPHTSCEGVDCFWQVCLFVWKDWR